jgi:hypothetical protein
MAQSKKAKPSADHQPGKKRNMNETTARWHDLIRFKHVGFIL